ncbi:phosphoribosylanthranilate isomerase [Salirhabdus salicampi]|uniref:phosphoribosylanthranilate isomerase n=1 Tax=Salirhabdus salicampi TaxID=476102 RepID=UPI0020C590AC|nr:phosphoribosylanthranilate isomerase [Salirhabdus salicampi]MCP8617982.1 phosphoribosylanthranilate isomerase [Salirhabdus salicampi]
MKVKICGIQDEATAKATVEAGADFIGFVFAESKRKITVERAKQIAEHIPSSVMKVGVFVNPSIEELEDTIREVGLDYAQLHGDESPEFCQLASVPVIKSFPIKEEKDVETAANYNVDYYLFDSPGGKYRGGSGLTFNWQMVKEVDIVKEKVIVAGGLKPENVEAAIEEVEPAIVDVSSGVETDGVKDIAKIETFIKRAKKEESAK